MIFRMVGYSMAQQSKNPDKSFEARMLAALFDRIGPGTEARHGGPVRGSRRLDRRLRRPGGSTIITEAQ